MDIDNLVYAVPVSGLIALIFAFIKAKNVSSQDPGNETMQKIANRIEEGAMAFLKAEYKYISIFVVIVGGLLFVNNGMETAIAFIAGAVASVVAGFSGMRAATSANGRTAFTPLTPYPRSCARDSNWLRPKNPA